MMGEAVSSWSSPPKILSVDHPVVIRSGMLGDALICEEKIDGSFFQFGVIDGELRVRSKGVELHLGSDYGMFDLAVAAAERLAPDLAPGRTYRAEYLRSPKHNTLTYSRSPRHNLVLFDALDGREGYISPYRLDDEAARIGLERVPWICLEAYSPAAVGEFVGAPSILGGEREGCVLKSVCPETDSRRDRFGDDGKAIMAKFVRPAFAEVHSREWRKSNPTSGDRLLDLANAYRTDARWLKAVQHGREEGWITGDPKDIGRLLKAVQADVREECEAAARDELWRAFRPILDRTVVKGLPDWYKALCAARAREEASE